MTHRTVFNNGTVFNSAFRSLPQDELNDIKNKLENAEVDNYGWSYIESFNNSSSRYSRSSAIYRYNKNDIKYVMYDDDYDQFMEMDHGEIWEPPLEPVRVENMYKRGKNQWWNKKWLWLGNIHEIYSIEDAMKKDWGKDIIRKRYRNKGLFRFVFRFVLLRIYILRYIRHLKHITWMPGSKAVMLIEQEYYRRNCDT